MRLDTAAAMVPSIERHRRARPASAKEVLETVRYMVDGDEVKLTEFRNKTRDLSQSRMTAMQYSDYVSRTFGAEASHQVLISVANAIPNNQLQAELHNSIQDTYSNKHEHVSERCRVDSLSRVSETSTPPSGLDRSSSFYRSRSDSTQNSFIMTEENPELNQVNVKIVKRLAQQGAVNLMNFR